MVVSEGGASAPPLGYHTPHFGLLCVACAKTKVFWGWLRLYPEPPDEYLEKCEAEYTETKTCAVCGALLGGTE